MMPPPDAPGIAPIVDQRKWPVSFLNKNKLVFGALAIATVLILIQMLSGPAPAAPTSGSHTQPPAPVPGPTAEALTTMQKLLRQTTAEGQKAAQPRTEPPPPVVAERPDGGAARVASDDPTVADLKRRQYEVRFGSNVIPPRGSATTIQTSGGATAPRAFGAFSDEPVAQTPARPSLEAITQAVMRAQGGPTATAQTAQSAPVAPQPAIPATTTPDPDTPVFRPLPTAGLHRVSIGTTIETTLEHELTIGGPINVLVSTDVYAHDLTLVIPKGSKVIGEAIPVKTTDEDRLAVTFSTILLPDGVELAISNLDGLNQKGDKGLKDKVNRHFLSGLAAAGAVGLVTGFSQWVGGGFGDSRTGSTIILGDVSQASAQLTAATMSRFLNRLPTISIRAGHRVRVYLRTHLDLPEWRS